MTEPKPDDKAGFPASNQIKAFDAKGLYQIETYTDIVAGEIRRLTPVNEHGVRDTSRSLRFFSSVTLNYGGRAMPVGFELQAATLADAIAGYPEQSLKAGTEFLDKLQDQQMKAALQGGRASAGMLGQKIVLPN